MGQRRLPANATQIENVTYEMCIKTVINARLKKINHVINTIKKLIS